MALYGAGRRPHAAGVNVDRFASVANYIECRDRFGLEYANDRYDMK